MRDIPIFNTDFGVASLFLKNIGLDRSAYIKIQDAEDVDKLLKACCDFCRSAGAEVIYVSGQGVPESYPVYTSVIKMSCKNVFPETDALLTPVQEQTMEQWRNIYNDKMKCVPAASQITFFDRKKYLDQGGCYFIYREDQLLGIGMVADDEIRVVASLQPGAGKKVVAALAKSMKYDHVVVHVADTNRKAICLYEDLGFVFCGVVETWHKIF